MFLGGMVYWKIGGGNSVAGDSTVPIKIDNQSGIPDSDIITVDTTFYNYRYDREMWNNARDQGSQSCYDSSGTPFHEFNQKLSAYYQQNGVKSGIYTGNFVNYYGDLLADPSKKVAFPGYYNFPWAANIANRKGDFDSVCQGIVLEDLDGFDGTVTSGTLMTKTSGGKVKVPYFDKEGFLESEEYKVNKTTIGVVKEHVGFPFRRITSGDRKGYYEFDSTVDVVRFSGMTGNPSENQYYYGPEGKLKYFYKNNDNEKVYCAASNKAQFFPFNNHTVQTSILIRIKIMATRKYWIMVLECGIIFRFAYLMMEQLMESLWYLNFQEMMMYGFS